MGLTGMEQEEIDHVCGGRVSRAMSAGCRWGDGLLRTHIRRSGATVIEELSGCISVIPTLWRWKLRTRGRR